MKMASADKNSLDPCTGKVVTPDDEWATRLSHRNLLL